MRRLNHLAPTTDVPELARLVDSPESQFYRPYAQNPWEAMTFTIRVAGDDPSRILPEVRRALHDVDPTLAAYATSSLEKIIEITLTPDEDAAFKKSAAAVNCSPSPCASNTRGTSAKPDCSPRRCPRRPT